MTITKIQIIKFYAGKNRVSSQQWVKILPKFYGKRRYIVLFKIAQNWSLPPSNNNPVHTFCLISLTPIFCIIFPLRHIIPLPWWFLNQNLVSISMYSPLLVYIYHFILLCCYFALFNYGLRAASNIITSTTLSSSSETFNWSRNLEYFTQPECLPSVQTAQFLSLR